ncbi:Subtilisin inhibitor-like protein 5 [Streptomyces sp. YIM 130001]|uniref:SSI family serine proteinase inhibitor n=1 Tax=Streptomyces sp. YIM 130001 TaxID=2259644 RepID=UPI000E658D22|nr:SSI family serine proteinase inhibitor [Streptomyces sp. YIM 130001]RII14284.1 Subtilisin inhibitor-like protein 5 [Streptomyces sp. YIM 130001]
MRPRTAAVPALFALVASLAVVAPARASAPVERPGLLLTVSGSDDTWIRGAELHCDPEPGGGHPQAAEACAALGEAHGDPGALPGEPRVCTKEYDPVTVTAEGTYDSKPVKWTKTFPNACSMHAASDPVFTF